ncbi:MAG: glycosyltransferase family 2 protein [Verrucomicrobia bacterium]|nr:glycosyltransferase family 2 protein [Verrucomicrobiota bacterium]
MIERRRPPPNRIAIQTKTNVYRGLKVSVLIPAYNEESKIGAVVSRVPKDLVDLILVVDDGSTDRTADVARAEGAEVLSLGAVLGVGAALRSGIRLSQSRGIDVAIFMAGNNKDEPKEIPRLLDPIVESGQDIVMGSRFLSGGRYGGDMPAYRKFATRLHPWLLSLFCGKRITESTNGFRAFRLDRLADRRIDLDQPWLDGYALEVYILYKFITLGFKHTEVPCTKIYPPKKLGITKMKPVVGWWDILRPVFILGLKLKR